MQGSQALHEFQASNIAMKKKPCTEMASNATRKAEQIDLSKFLVSLDFLVLFYQEKTNIKNSVMGKTCVKKPF